MAVVAGCGSSSKSSSSHPASSASQSAEASKPPDQIVADSAAALRSAPSYVMTGTIVQNGQRLALRLTTVAPRSLDLTLSITNATAEIISLPNAAYIRANARFWTLQAGAAAARLADRWIQVPPASAQSATSGLGVLAPQTLGRCLAENRGTLTAVGRAEIGGQPAVLVKDAGDKPGSAPGVLAVAATGTPYPLRYTTTGGQRAGGRIDVCNNGKATNAHGSVTFSQFGHVAAIQAPKNPVKAPGSSSS